MIHYKKILEVSFSWIIVLSIVGCSNQTSMQVTPTETGDTGPLSTVISELTPTPSIPVSTTIPAGLITLERCKQPCTNHLRFTDQNGKVSEFEVDGSNLVLSHNHKLATYEKQGDIFLINLETGQNSQITNTENINEKSVTWSPDDGKIAFLAQMDNQLTDIYKYDFKTGASINITNTPDRFENCVSSRKSSFSDCQFGWWKQLPDQLFFKSDNPDEAVPFTMASGLCHAAVGVCSSFPTSAAIDGSNYEILDELDGMDFLPALSPDGSTLAYDGGVLLHLKTKSKVVIDPSIYGIQVEHSENTRSNQMVSPIWSPNGKYIAWLVHTNQNGEYGIFILDYDTPSGRMVIQYVLYFITLSRAPWQVWDTSTIQWSPDSSKLLVTTQVSNRLSSEFNGVEGIDRSILWVVSADGSGTRRIGIGENNYESGVWSPDSTKIAFIKYEIDRGGFQSFLLHVDDWTITQLPVPKSNFPIAWVEIK